MSATDLERDGWHFWIDRGGTFTDIVARDPAGRLRTAKLLSSHHHYDDAAVEGIRRMLDEDERLPRRVVSVRMGTTVATNALLERRGEPVALVTTAGLKDVLEIGTQQRPDIFALKIERPQKLYRRVIEARERIGAEGSIIEPLDERALDASLRALRDDGFDALAIVLLHGDLNPEHERRAGAIARRLGFGQVSMSHATIALRKLVPRGDTTLVDAYLSPVLRRYVASVRRGLEALLGAPPPLLFMQSHGGLTEADRFSGKDSLLAGPAGGVIGMVATARAAGFGRVLGFDMGGTSTDVSLYAGELERTVDTEVAGVRIAAPMLRIHTVAAGGGSIVAFRGGRVTVGPASAGAEPGPASYRNGGPATVTDANVLLGRIQVDHFPTTFGPGADAPLDVDAARRAFSALADEIGAATGERPEPERVAEGAIRVAVEHMADAIRHISIERGHDVTGFTLASFGGAGGQHACLVADALGIDSVLIHPLAGVLSAYGIGIAERRELRRHSIGAALDDTPPERLAEIFDALAAAAARALGAHHAHGTPGADDAHHASGAPHASRAHHANREHHDDDAPLAGSESAAETLGRIGIRSAGSDTTMPLPWSPGQSATATRAAFLEAHQRLFGFAASSQDLMIDWLEAEAIAGRDADAGTMPPPKRTNEAPLTVRQIYLDGRWRDAPVHRRDELPIESPVEGPVLLVEAHATTLVADDWQVLRRAGGELVMTRTRPRPRRVGVGGVGVGVGGVGVGVGVGADPIMLEVFNNRFMHIAEQMGLVLEQTAHSVNIKERLDFSCALFDREGRLIANAPHVPVHLGSMGDSVASVLTRFGDSLAPGDAFALNAPYDGGTHLPDVTVVSPVYGAEGALEFLVASRAHHADIGGITPGSMPPASRSIDDEGVLIDCMRIVEQGRFLDSAVRAVLSSGRWPARNPERNIADLKAQLAANTRGSGELIALANHYGFDVVHAYMAHIARNAEECVRTAIGRLESGACVVDLDGGERVAVRIDVDAQHGEAHIDFTGTSPMSAGNLNAPPSIARAVVLYVFRTLVDEAIPLNAGCLVPLRVTLPEASLVNPRYPAAVVAGNVETSQCIADALLAALGALAASQGTMNNFTFGNARHQYYETLCGGAGAGPGFAGASGVHTHMTNSRLTDPEVLETRFPVRVRRFEIRRGSGGPGRWRGGDGVVREIEFLEPMHAAILSNRRSIAPFGLAGGEAGQPGRNRVRRADGTEVELAAIAEVDLAPGDRFIIETPGGGGYGAR